MNKINMPFKDVKIVLAARNIAQNIKINYGLEITQGIVLIFSDLVGL